MLKRILFIAIIFSFSFGFAQNDSYVYGDNGGSSSNSSDWKISDKFDSQRLTVGGGLALTFGTITYIEIAPTLGYYLTNSVLAGLGANYTYYSDNNLDVNTSLYGGRIFLEYIFRDLPLIAHTEAELINMQSFNNERINVINVYVGGGYKQSLGGSSYIYILGLWNLNETRESFLLQPNPLIRAGVAIGL